jgi:hypothetical protein
MIPPEEFSDILKELERLPIPVNKYRSVAGDGRSQAFGVVGRRGLPCDYSRQNWLRPYVYKLLLDFGSKHITHPYTSITVNQNYKASPHRDKGNVGPSTVVAFGEYEGGELEIYEGEKKGVYNVKHQPVVTDFSKALHSVRDFTGNRYSLVYYTAKKSDQLPPPSVREVDGKWAFFRGDEQIKGLPHPLKGRKKTLGNITVEVKDVIMSFD